MFLLRPLLASLLVALVLALGTAPAVAQEDGGASITITEEQYESWERTASAAEALIAFEDASTSALSDQRQALVGWRAQFLAAETANAERIDTIQAQIDALGPAPEDGVEEPDAIAERRADLAERLANAQVPRVRATEAFSRADGLIAEIDAILADRQAQELLELEPSPLNPVNWGAALTSLVNVLDHLREETFERLGNATAREQIANGAPAIVALVLFGLALILRGRVFVTRMGERFLDTDLRRGRTALGFVVSLGQVVLPLAGYVALIGAVQYAGLLTEEGQRLLGAGFSLILATYAGLWLAGRLFPRSADRAAAFGTAPANRAAFRRVLLLIGVFTGLANFAEVLASLDQVSPAARGVFLVPTHVGLAWMFLRLSALLKQMRGELSEAETSGFVITTLSAVITALRAIAVVGPLLGAVGYVNAASAAMLPTSVTLFILGVLIALQAVVRDVFALATRSSHDAAREALLPVIANFLLFLGALPILAVAWGVRPERLGDLYASALQGFSIGDTRITPGVILAVILVFAAGILATRLVQGALKTTVLPRTKMDTGARNAVTAGVGYVGIALAAIIAITAGGIDLTALGFVLGALSVGIGFGLQNVVSNFVSGIILLIERPISEGDWIEVGGNMGIVKSISVRSTTIETFDKTDVIVPNADFVSGTVTNWTRGNTVGRVVLTVGVAYGNDTRRVADILMEIAQSHEDVSSFPEPGVDFMGFGADSLDFRVRVILRNINLFVKVQTELYHRIAERFAQEGIEIPFAQRDIWLRNPEALQAPRGPEPVEVPPMTEPKAEGA